ncbi:hypothetical protein HPG69_000346 [Diceros bicornis minor]|uniref:SHC SH2 domain-containing protein n=1 Tax=Diceros bicornis minor TaxID=77932 RepID=A0A7J7EV85_DICBM|nr:hypothetical protein HPG69_000346 [Diceros bicornis minor]
MADAALAGGWLGSEAVAPVPGPERTGWAAEEEPAPLGKGFFQDEDSCSDCRNRDKPRAGLQSFVPEGATHFPEMFQTSHLLFYEPFRAYQGYIYVTDVGFAAFKAVVSVAAPYLCESQVSIWTLEHLKELLGLEEHQLPLQELWLVFDDSGVFDQTVLAIELVSDPLSAINACYEGDIVIVCPGRYVVHGTFSITDSIELKENRALKIQTSGEADAAERLDLEEQIQCATGRTELYARSDLSEQVEGSCEVVNEHFTIYTHKLESRHLHTEDGLHKAR